jgi:hypothetical protein
MTTVDELHAHAPRLPLYPTQEQYDAWFSYYKDRTRDVTGDAANEFWFVDLNDAVMNFLTLRELVRRHPEFQKKAEQIVDDVVRNAMGETGGMTMGAVYIARELGADPDEAKKIMFYDVFQRSA